MQNLKALAYSIMERPLEIASYKGPKLFSAMVRIRNEEEFLYPSIASIIDHIEEVVIIDNMSEDSTPNIIRQLEHEYPQKVKSYVYPHKIARQGEENRQLGSTLAGRFSPRLLANFYNWCLKRCTQPYVIKWDGDMIATSEFHRALALFRKSNKQVMWFAGTNVHPSLTHSTCTTGERFNEPYEPRIFSKRFAFYNNAQVTCENLATPYKQHHFSYFYEQLAYLHMKQCKRDAFSNLSAELHAKRDLRLLLGEPLSADMLAALQLWEITPRAAVQI